VTGASHSSRGQENPIVARLSEAGVAFGAPTIAWGRRPPTPPAMTITPRDRHILATVENLRYLTTSMIALLFWGKQTSAVHVRLKLLHDAGYLDKLRPRVKAGEASREWVYRLSEFGWHEIVSRSRPDEADAYRPAELTSISYLEHDLQVNALVLHVAALAAAERGWQHTGPLVDVLPFEILGPRAGVIDSAREVRSPNASESSALGPRVVRREQAQPGRLEPDATLLGADRHGRRTAVMIEYDRTRRPHRQTQKLRRYDHFLTAGWRETRYAELDIEPVVVFVCESDARIPSFVREADKHLTAWHGKASTARSSGEHVGREQIAITSRPRLLSCDWRVVQVPSLPREVASRGTGGNFIERRFALPLLFRTSSARR
jgi:hypothetical protein